MPKQTTLEILIVDDDLDIPLALGAMIRKLAEVNISIAVDGQDALAALAESKFDALFLDLQLPLVSGEEVLDEIFEGGDRVQKPSQIIVMSAGSRLEEIQQKPSAKVIDGFLEKPFQYSDLQEIIADVSMGDFMSDV